ncbi:acyl-CoA synthetase (AMP-forming)/AMP-acid ligase II [Bacillus ectoiniformans]|uniref:class I adenylate-forming enzyme family protein n=1 Tax=Bacillus ectoiniformans TaxID=1494429 RepID=UPI00195D8FEC|nr:AMP-binding protein [Bacillus ectoiniformans]MBM7648676.1 acyl-CoA synthetase (AMP-forming)/AMP-acid ligase II [Bacillus ectoiniformans]
MFKPNMDFMNVGMMLTRNARHYPNKLAVIHGDERLTYRQFNERVNQVAHSLLQFGFQKGDRLAMLLPNSLEMLELFWATAKIGVVIVPLNPMVKGKDNVHQLNDCRPKMLVFHQSYEKEIEEIKNQVTYIEHFVVTGQSEADDSSYHNMKENSRSEEPNVTVTEDDVVNIMYSSGTTGLPKGIVHTHKTRVMYAFLWGMEYGVTAESVVLSSGSLVFNGSLAFMYPTICAGATYILESKFNKENVMGLIETEQVTHTMMVPTQIITILDLPAYEPKRLSSLKVLLTLGAPLPISRKEQICEQLPGILFELYGLTEGFLTTLRPDYVLKKPGSVGPPMIFNECKIVDGELNEVQTGEVGEIVGRGPTLMAGYLNKPEETLHTMIDDKWIKTGDLGYVDEDGYVYLVDRKKDMIISGGVNIYPRDIEEVASAHPSVSQVAVVGAPDEKWGEIPVAHIELKPGERVDENELMAWVNERVPAKYQRLKALYIVDELPKNASGKILKRKLRDQYKEVK